MEDLESVVYNFMENSHLSEDRLQQEKAEKLLRLDLKTHLPAPELE